MDSNHRRHSQQIYSLPPLATWVTYQTVKNHAPDGLFGLCLPGPYRKRACDDWKKKRLSPVQGRQMAVIFTSPAFTALWKQRGIFCKNQNQGQDYSAVP